MAIKEQQNWFYVRGDETLALDWPLNENSLVWEIGGFEGRWVRQIWDKFGCNITVFEPQIWACKRLREKFIAIPKVQIHPYGLWISDTTLSLNDYYTDGASVVKPAKGKDRADGDFRYYAHQFSDLHIDVCLMNIEGGEYVLLPEFIRSGVIRQIDNFWCQFHPGYYSENDHQTFDEICAQLEETHEMLWNCYPTAVAWRKK